MRIIKKEELKTANFNLKFTVFILNIKKELHLALSSNISLFDYIVLQLRAD